MSLWSNILSRRVLIQHSGFQLLAAIFGTSVSRPGLEHTVNEFLHNTNVVRDSNREVLGLIPQTMDGKNEIVIPDIGETGPTLDGVGNPFNWQNGSELSEALHGFFQLGSSKTDQNVIIAIDGNSGSIDIKGVRRDVPRGRDGVQHIHGRLIVRNADREVAIILDGKDGSIRQRGDLRAYDNENQQRIHMSGTQADITIQDETGASVVHLDGRTASVILGNGRLNGGLQLIGEASDKPTIALNGGPGDALFTGKVSIGTEPSTDDTVNLQVARNALFDGQVGIGKVPAAGMALDVAGSTQLETLSISTDIQIGGALNVVEKTTTKTLQVTEKVIDDLKVEGDITTESNLNVSQAATVGTDLTVVGVSILSEVTAQNTATKTLQVTEKIIDDLTVAGAITTESNLNVSQAATVGANLSVTKDLDVVGTTSTGILKITGGQDLAEPFTVHSFNEVAPGMVVSIDPDRCGLLRLASKPYDRTVAGVVSGAGDITPGLILQQGAQRPANSHHVALAGRVFVWCETSNGTIQPGDLLTSSTTMGHAMKVTDYEKAQGAIIGKAMSSLMEESGLVLALVSLQ